MKTKIKARAHGVVLLVALAAALAGRAMGIPYENPLWTHEAYDATWMKTAAGIYYLTSTEREVLRSRDFIHWELVANDFFDAETLRNIRVRWPNIWAPKIMDFTGKGDYRIYVAHNRNDLDAAIFVYRSDRPEGPYRDGRMITAGPDTGIKDTIDPDVIRDPETGKWWMFFGSIGGDYILELASDGLSAAPGAKPIHIAGLKMTQSLRRWCVYEGTSIVRHGGWWYYLAGAGEWSTRNYRIVCGRSKSLTGPYVDREGRKMADGYAETVAASGADKKFFSPGHPSEMFTSPTGRTYIFHFCNSSLGWKKGRVPAPYFRPLMLSELMWSEDGWPFVEGGTVRHGGVLQ